MELWIVNIAEPDGRFAVSSNFDVDVGRKCDLSLAEINFDKRLLQGRVVPFVLRLAAKEGMLGCQ